MVKNREVKKTYWAVVGKELIPQSQRLVHYLKKNEKNNKAIVFPKATEGAKEAILTYHVIKTLDNYLLLEIDLETGRHHQIRAQLSKTGVPIKGDLKYGSPRSNPDGGINLHARKLEFIHPVTKEKIEIVAPFLRMIQFGELAKNKTRKSRLTAGFSCFRQFNFAHSQKITNFVPHFRGVCLYRLRLYPLNLIWIIPA